MKSQAGKPTMGIQIKCDGQRAQKKEGKPQDA